MAKKSFITNVDVERKIITTDSTVIPTPAESARFSAYLTAGYTERVKSQEKSRQMKERADSMPSNDEIVEALANHTELLEKYKAIKKMKDNTIKYNGGCGFFSARSWYTSSDETKVVREEVKKKKEEEAKKKKGENK